MYKCKGHPSFATQGPTWCLSILIYTRARTVLFILPQKVIEVQKKSCYCNNILG
ncbi:hypothetical protein PDIG_11320 [Penicillium digitatum PHI26]|uniref:Uncharacterized protein n=2 Tax=Penicillium digitatum TaxID=36651 RepID=K9GAR3_PEND2|nr:hypothetical protein PDIP_82820 [Penicillium digitatum Pd1]EKV05528.1 hypothetical protein PDIP_82820 [Penicillium digitatum Pd1]EKV18184.1 hypothetical protein PDIG_11320 [Penicillium digitatum PHI26]